MCRQHNRHTACRFPLSCIPRFAVSHQISASSRSCQMQRLAHNAARFQCTELARRRFIRSRHLVQSACRVDDRRDALRPAQAAAVAGIDRTSHERSPGSLSAAQSPLTVTLPCAHSTDLLGVAALRVAQRSQGRAQGELPPLRGSRQAPHSSRPGCAPSCSPCVPRARQALAARRMHPIPRADVQSRVAARLTRPLESTNHHHHGRLRQSSRRRRMRSPRGSCGGGFIQTTGLVVVARTTMSGAPGQPCPLPPDTGVLSPWTAAPGPPGQFVRG